MAAATTGATAVSSDASAASTDGPVLTMMSKRLRALRKKYNRIIQMEESVAQGKALNKEQEDVLRSKPAVITLIDEYERLRQPLASAVQEELTLAQATSSSPSSSSPPPAPDAAAAAATQQEEKGRDLDASLEDLLKLLYFGSLFDVKPQSDYETTMLLRTHERGCCITYDTVTDETTSLLEEKDLDMISVLCSLVLSRPSNSNDSHKNALINCLQHAKLWLHNSDQPIQPGSSLTYAGLRERLSKILASNYSTATPEIKPSLDLADLAAGVGKYAVSQPQGNDSAVPAPAVHTEVPTAQDQVKVDDSDGSVKREDDSSHSSQAEELPQQHEDIPSTNVEPEQVQGYEEQSQRDGEFEQQQQQQYTSRRGFHNQRGVGRGGNGYGGRRGYANGRGGRGGRGGGYQNGRSQYSDSGYYSRGYYNPRGRGGRGGSSYNQGAADYGGQLSGVELGAS